MLPLYKTTIVVWTPTPDPVYGRPDLDLPSYCSKNQTELVTDPATDPDWDLNVVFIDGDFQTPSEKDRS